MGSGASHNYYAADLGASELLCSSDEGIRTKASLDRSVRIAHHRSTLGEDKVLPMRATAEMYDEGSVKLGITRPADGVKKVWIVLIDNSGSNRAIAHKLRQDSGYLTAFLKTLDGESQIAFNYFSDHVDEPKGGLMQEIDFVHPNQKGDKIICSTLHKIHNAWGGDEPEAIECVLKRVCEIDFNDAEERHLILISDVVAHGMGMPKDDGCPNQCDWKKSLQSVRETFTSFLVVGSGNDKKTGKLQEQFIAPERVGLDLIDLSSIKQEQLRLGMAANAILFLIARQNGKQAVELFLSALYEKWLAESIFGLESDDQAKDMVRRLAKFLEYPQEEIDVLLKKVLIED